MLHFLLFLSFEFMDETATDISRFPIGLNHIEMSLSPDVMHFNYFIFMHDCDRKCIPGVRDSFGAEGNIGKQRATPREAMIQKVKVANDFEQKPSVCSYICCQSGQAYTVSK